MTVPVLLGFERIDPTADPSAGPEAGAEGLPDQA